MLNSASFSSYAEINTFYRFHLLIAYTVFPFSAQGINSPSLSLRSFFSFFLTKNNSQSRLLTSSCLGSIWQC